MCDIYTNTEWTIQWDWLKLLDIFGYFVIIIGSLMYNELLIVHVADLDQDITVVVKDAEGSVLETITYSLADYLVGVAAQNEGVIGEYAQALWNLSKVVG